MFIGSSVAKQSQSGRSPERRDRRSTFGHHIRSGTQRSRGSHHWATGDRRTIDRTGLRDSGVGRSAETTCSDAAMGGGASVSIYSSFPHCGSLSLTNLSLSISMNTFSPQRIQLRRIHRNLPVSRRRIANLLLSHRMARRRRRFLPVPQSVHA